MDLASAVDVVQYVARHDGATERVAELVGYHSVAFKRLFKQRTGDVPAEWRRRPGDCCGF